MFIYLCAVRELDGLFLLKGRGKIPGRQKRTSSKQKLRTLDMQNISVLHSVCNTALT